MIDYKDRIKERAKICNVELTEIQLQRLNFRVNARVERGVDIRDALDYAYLYIKNNYSK
jgi:hypothetical protein